jgi:hypothetical protein
MSKIDHMGDVKVKDSAWTSDTSEFMILGSLFCSYSQFERRWGPWDLMQLRMKATLGKNQTWKGEEDK